jgi:hypothetical protein
VVKIISIEPTSEYYEAVLAGIVFSYAAGAALLCYWSVCLHSLWRELDAREEWEAALLANAA